MCDINEIIKDINAGANKENDINKIADDIVKHFGDITGIDLNDYVYKDDENIGGECNEQL